MSSGEKKQKSASVFGAKLPGGAERMQVLGLR